MKQKIHGHRLSTRGRAAGEEDWEEYFERLEQREDGARFHPARDPEDEPHAERRRGQRVPGRRRSRGPDVGQR